METIHLTMDLMTYLAICTVILSIGGFTIAFMRVKNSVREDWNEKIPSRTYSIVDDKIKKFQEGSCSSERDKLLVQMKAQSNICEAELKAVKEILHGELIQINTILDSKIAQVNSTLSNGLERIEKKIKDTEKKIINEGG